jgi:molecular chaperone GrpE
MKDQETTQPGSAESPDAGDGALALESLLLERDNLQMEKAELQDALLRRAAEFDNFRKRAERERADHFEYAAADAVKLLLPVLDDFERALKTPCSDPDYVKGIELIYQRLFEALRKLGLEPIETAGQTFDPNFHHAIEMVHDTKHADQAIVAELLRGYTFKGRLLRAAMVKVAVHKG